MSPCWMCPEEVIAAEHRRGSLGYWKALECVEAEYGTRNLTCMVEKGGRHIHVWTPNSEVRLPA